MPAAIALCALLVAGTASAQPSREVYVLTPAGDAAVMGTSALAALLPHLFASEIIQPRCPCRASDVNDFDRFAVDLSSGAADVVSTVTLALAVLAPPALDVVELGANRAFGQDAMVFAESLLVNAALVQIAKYATQRPLPRTYAGVQALIDRPGGYRSFYSGHTSTAFTALATAAYTLRLRYGEHTWPWLVAAGVGTSVAVERVLSGQHFPTDVIVGAIVGTTVGVVIPWLHARDRNPVGVSALPTVAGFSFGGTF